MKKEILELYHNNLNFFFSFREAKKEGLESFKFCFKTFEVEMVQRYTDE